MDRKCAVRRVSGRRGPGGARSDRPGGIRPAVLGLAVRRAARRLGSRWPGFRHPGLVARMVARDGGRVPASWVAGVKVCGANSTLREALGALGADYALAVGGDHRGPNRCRCASGRRPGRDASGMVLAADADRDRAKGERYCWAVTGRTAGRPACTSC